MDKKIINISFLFLILFITIVCINCSSISQNEPMIPILQESQINQSEYISSGNYHYKRYHQSDEQFIEECPAEYSPVLKTFDYITNLTEHSNDICPNKFCPGIYIEPYAIISIEKECNNVNSYIKQIADKCVPTIIMQNAKFLKGENINWIQKLIVKKINDTPLNFKNYGSLLEWRYEPISFYHVGFIYIYGSCPESNRMSIEILTASITPRDEGGGFPITWFHVADDDDFSKMIFTQAREFTNTIKNENKSFFVWKSRHFWENKELNVNHN